MSESPLTRRLHVSGLTPSITPADLERRLSSFGKVKAMDGFGARDSLGDPRKFGFVTMEIGAKELTKCLNVLSGSTWKGAKLRIGEARPDFRERLAQFNSKPPRPVLPKRTRFRNYGYPSSTLPLTPLSATVAASTPGWIATPSGRVVRPMRMRPVRPLAPTRSELNILTKGVNGKVKKRLKPPPSRARRRLIDPTNWDSGYLRGVFLDAVSVPASASRQPHESSHRTKHDIVDESAEEEETDPDAMEGEDQSLKEANHAHPEDVEETHEIDAEIEDLGQAANSGVSTEAAESGSRTNLKTLFAPREEASFSLLDHLELELDLELGADIIGISSPSGVSRESVHPPKPIVTETHTAQLPGAKKTHSRLTIDPFFPLLFPPADSLPHPYTASASNTTIRPLGTSSCVVFPSATLSRSLRRLPPSITFTRSPEDTSESIRETWEKDKSLLTHEWKKAWREARGNRTGRVGFGGEVGGSYLG